MADTEKLLETKSTEDKDIEEEEKMMTDMRERNLNNRTKQRSEKKLARGA